MFLFHDTVLSNEQRERSNTSQYEKMELIPLSSENARLPIGGSGNRSEADSLPSAHVFVGV